MGIFICSPYLLKHAQPEPFVNGEHLVASSSKLIVIDKLLADILPKGEQVLIFSVSQTTRLALLRSHPFDSNGQGLSPTFT
jgi:hypothetical protein